MAEFFFDYGLFALKAITIVIAILLVVLISVAAGMKTRKSPEGNIEVTRVNDEIDHLKEALTASVIDPDVLKIETKQKQKTEKAERKANLKALKKDQKKSQKKR